jgi:adenine deaminase
VPERRLRLVDLHRRVIHPAKVVVEGDRIASIEPLPESAPLEPGFILPGFVDAHVHIESSMLPPVEFARVAVRHGTVATVSDPHEIANVLGEAGIEFMLDEASRACMPIAFGVPSCVPATTFECAGATLDSRAVARLLADPRLSYLSEMMNWPGVLSGDSEVLAKMASAAPTRSATPRRGSRPTTSASRSRKPATRSPPA